MSRCSYLGTGIPVSQSPCGQKTRDVKFREFTGDADNDTHTQISNHTWTLSHSYTQLQQQQQQWGPVSASPAAFLHQTSSFRDGCQVDAVNAEQQRLLCGCRQRIPPTGLVVLSHCGKLGEWRIAVFLTMTMNETLRCLNTVSVEGGRLEPRQQVNHLCPFPSHSHTTTHTHTHQMKSVQWLQKVGCLKKRAMNLWFFTSCTFFWRRAP